MDLHKTEAIGSDINSQQNSLGSENIFVVQPEPKKPADKKSVWLTVILTILGIIVLIGVFIFAIIGSASGLANNYRSHALVQMKKIDSPLKDLEPSLVLNNRDIGPATNKIYISKQAQPTLENTLFVGAWSSRYVTTEKIQTNINSHYEAISSYTNQLGQLINFDDSTALITQQESELVKKVNPNDPLSIRSVGGTYQNFASQVKKLEVPSQLTLVQKAIARSYSDRADLYTQWAVAIEAGDKSKTDLTQTQVQASKSSADALTTDKNYTKLFTPTYQKIITDQKALESALSN